MDYQDISEYIRLGKDGMELLKSAISYLPKGPKRDEAEKKVLDAEQLLKRSDAKLAKDLGMRLCECTFPPQPMLWKEHEKAYVCQNPDCGRRFSFEPKQVIRKSGWVTSRRG